MFLKVGTRIINLDHVEAVCEAGEGAVAVHLASGRTIDAEGAEGDAIRAYFEPWTHVCSGDASTDPTPRVFDADWHRENVRERAATTPA